MNLSFPSASASTSEAAMDARPRPSCTHSPIGDDEAPRGAVPAPARRSYARRLDEAVLVVTSARPGQRFAASATARALTLVDAPIVIAATAGGLATTSTSATSPSAPLRHLRASRHATAHSALRRGPGSPKPSTTPPPTPPSAA